MYGSNAVTGNLKGAGLLTDAEGRGGLPENVAPSSLSDRVKTQASSSCWSGVGVIKCCPTDTFLTTLCDSLSLFLKHFQNHLESFLLLFQLEIPLCHQFLNGSDPFTCLEATV